jgi:hypothetical protein
VGWGDVGVQWAGGKVCSGHALAMLCHPMSISSPVCVNFTPCLFYPLSVSPPYVCFHPMSVSPLGCNKSSIYKSNTCVVSVCECVCVCMCVCQPLSVSSFVCFTHVCFPPIASNHNYFEYFFQGPASNSKAAQLKQQAGVKPPLRRRKQPLSSTASASPDQPRLCINDVREMRAAGAVMLAAKAAAHATKPAK